MPGLEMIEAAQDVKDGFLNQVSGVEVPSGGGGQPPVRPPFQLRKAALQEGFHRSPIAIAGLEHEFYRGLIAEQGIGAPRASAGIGNG